LRIIASADALLRQVDATELRVSMIADDAGLSAATVYNLFGTKAAILKEVYERDRAGFERLVAETTSSDSLDQIFECLSMSAEKYRADPRFYRSVMRIPTANPAHTDVDDQIFRLRIEFWTDMVAAAIRDGHLREDTNPTAAGMTLTYIATGTLFYWLSNLINIDRFEHDTIYGFGAHLLTFASEDARDRIGRRLAT
jgi:AcrR family transcriptional regulator